MGRLLAVGFVCLASLSAQDIFFGSLGFNRNSNAGAPTDPLYIYDGTANTVRNSDVHKNASTTASFGIIDGARRSLLAVEKANTTYVFGALDGLLRIHQYVPGGTPSSILTPVTDVDPGGYQLRAMALSPDRNTLYVGIREKGVRPYSFNTLYRIDITDPTLPGTPELIVDLAPNECYEFDVHPNGNRLIAACVDNNGTDARLIDIDIPGKVAAAPVLLAPYVWNVGGTLRIEPTQGKFAYLASAGTTDDNILAIDLTGPTLAVNAEISGSGPGFLEFRPSGRTAYIFSKSAIGQLETAAGKPATAAVFTPNPVAAYYGGLVTESRIYTIEVNNNVRLVLRDIDFNLGTFAVSASPTPVMLIDAPTWSGTAGGTYQGMAIAQQALIPITAKVDPALPTNLSVALNNLPPANSTTVLVPLGTVLPLDNVLSPQPAGFTTSTARYSFLNWTKNNPCPTPSFSALATPATDPALAGTGDTYCACFEKEWYVALNVTGTGACTNTALNNVALTSGGLWVKEGTTVKGTGTAPTGGSIAISPDVIADAAGKSITITCTSTVVNPPGCISPPKPGNLLTWYTFDEPSSPAINRGAGFRHPGNHVKSPTPAAGRVNGALSFNGSNYVEAAFSPEGDVSTGNFSIDLWIRTTSSTGVHTIIDKRVMSPRVLGYSLYLGNGRPAIQLADASGSSTTCGTTTASSCTNWGVPATSPNVADGQWHFLAVTVDRASPTGGRFYVDGALVGTFDPRLRQGSLSNNALLRMGSAQDGQFNGTLDEIEIFDTVLSPQDISALFNAGSGGKCRDPLPPVPQCLPTATLPGMIGWYPLDEPNPPLSVSLAGARVGASWSALGPVNSIPGKVGRALRFQGLSHIEASVPTAYDFSGPAMSFDLWVRFTNSGRMTVLDKRTGTGPQQIGYELFVNGGQPGFSLYSGTNVTTGTATGPPINDNQWHLVVVTVRQSVGGVDMWFYVDGQPAGFEGMLSPVGGTLVNPAPFRVGRNSTGAQGQPGGYIGDADEVEIFDRLLTASEVALLFAAGSNGKCKPAAATTTAPVTVNTNPAGKNMIVGVQNQPGLPLQGRTLGR